MILLITRTRSQLLPLLRLRLISHNILLLCRNPQSLRVVRVGDPVQRRRLLGAEGMIRRIWLFLNRGGRERHLYHLRLRNL